MSVCMYVCVYMHMCVYTLTIIIKEVMSLIGSGGGPRKELGEQKVWKGCRFNTNTRNSQKKKKVKGNSKTKVLRNKTKWDTEEKN